MTEATSATLRRAYDRRRAWSCLGTAALAVVAFSACGTSSEPTRASLGALSHGGGTARLGNISDVNSWNEYLAKTTFEQGVLRRIFLRLARERPGPPGQPPLYEPELAESWNRSEDGRRLSFRLGDARWSDGRPITAEDVRFTWLAQTSEEVAWSGVSPSKQHIVDVEVVDPSTVVFHFDTDYPYQLADAVDGGIVPRHVFGAVPFAKWRSHDWSQHRVGSGPFVLERHRTAEEIVLTRNPSHRRAAGTPGLGRVVIRIVPDVTNLLTQLRAGGLDFVDNLPAWEAGAVTDDPQLTLLAYESTAYDHIGWNARRPPFDEAEVRRALTLAIDRQALVDELLYGYGRVAVGPIPSHRWGAVSGLQPWPHDPVEARRILASRGFRPGADGVLERDGQPFRFAMLTNAGNARREAAVIKIQEHLRRVGIDMTPQPLEMATLGSRCGSGDYAAYLGAFSHSERDLPSLFGSAGSMNVVGYRSAVLDSLFERMDAAPDRESLQALLAEIQREIHQVQPFTFLHETRRLAAVGPRLRGVEISDPSDPLAFLEHAWVEP